MAVDVADAAGIITFDCPRCGTEASARFYGPCGSCRDELVAVMGPVLGPPTPAIVEPVEYRQPDGELAAPAPIPERRPKTPPCRTGTFDPAEVPDWRDRAVLLAEAKAKLASQSAQTRLDLEGGGAR